MHTAINIFNRMVDKGNEEQMFSTILKGDVKKNVSKYFEIIDKLHDIITQITNDKYGRLISTIKNVRLTWEVYDLFILPVFYESGKFNSDIIQLLVKFLFRTVGHETTKLSNFAYTNKFKDIRQKIFENKDYDYYDDIIEVFRKNIGRLAEKEFFLDNSLQ